MMGSEREKDRLLSRREAENGTEYKAGIDRR